MTIAIEDRATRKHLGRASRGLLPEYESPSTRSGWAPRYVVYNMDDGSEDRKRNRAVTAAIIGGGVAALACMAQHYGALDSDIVSGAMDILGIWGTPTAATVPTYVLGRLVQG